jgi:hypothetical protein
MRIEVEVFEDKMPSLLGTSEEESTSEPETAVDVEFDGNWQSHAYSNSNVSRTQLNEIVHVIQTSSLNFVNN